MRVSFRIVKQSRDSRKALLPQPSAEDGDRRPKQSRDSRKVPFAFKPMSEIEELKQSRDSRKMV